MRMVELGDTARPLPEPTALSRPFWDATARGQLMLQRCERCGGYEWTPQAACSRCLEETLRWVEVSGRGTVYSFTVVHRGPSPYFRAPYMLAIVELSEGPRMLAPLRDVRDDELRVGLPVKVAFEDAGPLALYGFIPDRAS